MLQKKDINMNIHLSISVMKQTIQNSLDGYC